MTEGAARIGRPPPDPQGDNRQDQRAGIGQHVSGLGEEGDGVGDVSAHRFNDCEGAEDQQGKEQSALASVVAVVMATRPMMVAVPVSMAPVVIGVGSVLVVAVPVPVPVIIIWVVVAVSVMATVGGVPMSLVAVAVMIRVVVRVAAFFFRAATWHTASLSAPSGAATAHIAGPSPWRTAPDHCARIRSIASMTGPAITPKTPTARRSQWWRRAPR